MKLKGKKVLVTGADGFIGSHLAEMLVKEGATVRALAIYNSMGSWGWLENSALNNEMEIILGDVRDSHCCHQITKEVEIIFNLAALIAIPYSYKAPNSYVDTNINGTLNICQGALYNDVKKVIQTSTSEVYGTAQYVPIDEQHPLQPQSPYSASKIGADALAMSFCNSFGLPVSIARPFNTYGPRQSARAVIPTIISQIATGETEIKLGDVSPTRDFNYVEDTCRGLLLVSECEKAIGETINIGSNYEISIEDTVNKIISIMGRKVKVVTDEQRLRPEKSEVNRLWCNNRKLHSLTGFIPEINLDEGLRRTIKWFENSNNLSHYKGGIYNV